MGGSLLASGHLGAAVASLVAVVAVVAAMRRSVAAAIGVVLLALIAASGSVSSIKEPFLTARWAALGAIAVLLVPHAVRQRWAVLRTGVYLVPLPIFALLSAAWSTDPRLTVERAVSFAALLWVVTVAAVRFDRREVDGLTDTLAALSLVVVAASIALLVVSSRAVQNGWFRGVFENANGLGIFLGLTYPFLAAACDRRRRPLASLVVLAGYVVIGFAAHARGGLVGLAVAALVYYLARGAAMRYLAAGLVLVGCVAVAGAIAVRTSTDHNASNGANQANHVISSGASTSSQRPRTVEQSRISRLTGARSEAWSATADFIGSKPVLGYGFGSGDRIFALYPERVHFIYFQGANPANAYLQLLLELGFVGAALFLAPLLLATWWGVRVAWSRSAGADLAAQIALLAGALFVAVVESVFTSAGAPWELLIWLSVAILVTRPVPAVTALEGERPLAVWRPSPRLLAGIAIGCIAAAGVAIGIHEATRPGPPPKLGDLVRELARARCGPQCRVAELVHLTSGSWWVRMSGARNVCVVIDRSSFRDAHSSSGVLETRCEHLPLVHRHQLTVAVAKVEPPYFFTPLENPGGFEPALGRELARSLGIGLIRWTSARARADLELHAFVATPFPRGFLPYRIFREELLARRGSPVSRVRSVADLRGFRLGVVAGPAVAFVRRMLEPRNRVVVYESREQATGALDGGTLDGLLDDEASAAGVKRSHPEVTAVGLMPADHAYGIAFPRSSKVARLVTERFRLFEASGGLAKLRDRELGALPPVRVLG